MGDRANVAIKGDYDGLVFFYTHWGGESLPETVRRALARRERWTDPSYLRRIVFCELLRNESEAPLDSALSLGISDRMGDNEHPLIALDCQAQTVEMHTPTDTPTPATCRARFTFEIFASADKRGWSDFHKREALAQASESTIGA